MKILMLILLFSVFLLDRLMSSQVKYFYVTPDDINKNSCPSNGAQCHSLSDYANRNLTERHDDVTFILMKGKHTLNTTFDLRNLNRVSLIGQGQWINGSQWPAMESTVVIRCSNDSDGSLRFVNIREVYLKNFTIIKCIMGMIIYNVHYTHVNFVSFKQMGYTGFIHKVTGIFKFISVKLLITNCSFHENCLDSSLNNGCAQAMLSKNFLFDVNITYIITYTTFSSGGTSLTIYESDKVIPTHHAYDEIIIDSCLFYNNTGNVGGITVLRTYVSFLMQDTTFLNNTSVNTTHNSGELTYSTGAVFLGISSPTKPTRIISCLFKYNKAAAAGGIAINPGDCGDKDKHCLTYINATTFIGNSGQRGSAISIKTSGLVYFTDVYIAFTKYDHELPPNQYSALYLNCNNHIEGVIIFVNLTLYSNNMTGMISIGCNLIFQYELSLIADNRSPLDGGGIWIDDESSIISSGIQMINFSNNTAARYGGAIYSDAMIVLPSDLLYLPNTLCQFSKLNVNLNGNTAGVAGNDIYGGRYYGCVILNSENFSKSVDFIGLISCNFSKTIFNGIPKPLSHHSISSKPYGVCYCDFTGAIECSERSIDISVYPGQWIDLPLVTIGNCGGISPGLLLTTSHKIDVTLGDSNQQTSTTCKAFHYKVKQTYSISGQFTLTTGEFNIANSSFTVNVNFKQCPFGFKLNEGICICDNIIESINNVNCNISTYENLLTRSGNNWLYYSHQHNCTIAYKNCPFDYCNTSTISLNLDDPDVQCSFNRSGILCGQCPPGLSLMLGSNRCGSCSNYYLFLIPVFIIAGLGLITILLTLNLTTSMGTINGLLFYANIMKLNEPVIFPNTNIPVLTQFIAWLNLDFGFDVCFFNGLDGYWKTWLQYIFSLTLIIFIILCCKFSGKLSRLFGKNVITALSTLIFMANTKLLLTIRNALMISPIECNDTVLYVWSVDGNINYLSGKHIPLVVVSLLFLLTGLVYTVMIFSTQWLQKYGGRYCRSSFDPYVRLQPFIDAETGPYKDMYRYYRGIHLMIYLTLTAVFSYTTGTIPYLNNYITAFVSFTLLPFIKGKYKSKINTCLEFFFIFNLGVTSLFNIMDHPLMTYVITVTSICLSILVFIGIVFYHSGIVIKHKCGKKCTRHQNIAPRRLLDTNEMTETEEMDGSPARIISRRESLIFEFDV